MIQGHAEDLPFDDESFDASMALLTIHHWVDKQKGLAEMRRVTRGPILLLTYDPKVRAAMSPFRKITNISDALNRLESDLETAAWKEKYGHLLQLDFFDAGYRLIRA